MKMQFNTLPDKLIECALWCVWKYEDRDGKPTKVPYNPRTGGRAQSNNPATFSDFKTAVAAFGTCKPNQKEQFKIPKERISKFFAPGTPAQKIEDTIVKALDFYRKRQREQER